VHLTKNDWILVSAVAVGAAGLGAFASALPTGVVAGVLLFAGVLAVGIVVFETYRRLLGAIARVADEPNENYRQFEALWSIHRMIDLRCPLPRFRGAAVSPDFALILGEHIERVRPQCIVELGCGASTVVAAAMLRQCGQGRILSLEQDRSYAEQCRVDLGRYGLESVARVVHAPLVPVTIGRTDWRWYDMSALGELKEIDLLVVDGPAQQNQAARLIRYPALPLLNHALKTGAIILVDDTNRSDEQQVVARWLSEFPDLHVEWPPAEKGAAILHRGCTGTQASDDQQT
jgi:predicted O-methyltransferase YrrM